jgi:hypothetical protein
LRAALLFGHEIVGRGISGSVVLTTPSSLPILIALAAASSGLASSSHPASASTSERRSSSVPSTPCPILSGGSRACLGYPVGSWNLLARPLTGGLEDAPWPLLAAGLAAHPFSLRENHIHNSGIPLRCGVDRVFTPEVTYSSWQLNGWGTITCKQLSLNHVCKIGLKQSGARSKRVEMTLLGNVKLVSVYFYKQLYKRLG